MPTLTTKNTLFMTVLSTILLVGGGVIPGIQNVHSLETRRPAQFRHFLSTVTTRSQSSISNLQYNIQRELQAGTSSALSSTVIGTKDLVERKTRKVVDSVRGGNIKAQNFLQDHPFASAVIITTVNAVCADLMTQLVLERSAGAVVWNWQRTALFGAFGFFFQGFCQYAIVNWGWEKLFPGTSTRAVASKVCGMNLVSDPLFFFPAFYLFKQILVWQSGASAATATVVEGTGRLAALTSFVSSALSSYHQNAWSDWKNSWMVWFPGHAVTYGVMPKHKRIPWMAFLSFFYMCVLSLTRGGA
jgi:Mpv17 / PMP22 family